MAPCLFTCFDKKVLVNDVHGTVMLGASIKEQHRRGAVLIKLFSSQRCKTSLEVELSRLRRGDFALEAPLIMLAFHVDYWDYMGWKDPYGSRQSIVRPKAYIEALKLDTMFIPQVVVQRRPQCVANDEEPLLSMWKRS